MKVPVNRFLKIMAPLGLGLYMFNNYKNRGRMIGEQSDHTSLPKEGIKNKLKEKFTEISR